MEWLNVALVAGSTTRFVVVDSEREAGKNIEGYLQARVPKGGGQPGASLELRFVTEHVFPVDPTWDGHGEPPAKIRADAKQAEQDALEEAAEDRQAEQEKAAKRAAK